MTTIAQSILDFIAIHQQQTCHICRGFVDCVRLNALPICHDGGIRFPKAARRGTCPDCQIKAASDDDERHQLQAEFDALRAMRMELGLGRDDADGPEREALHMRGPRTTTFWSELTPTHNPAISAAVSMVLGGGVDWHQPINTLGGPVVPSGSTASSSWAALQTPFQKDRL